MRVASANSSINNNNHSNRYYGENCYEGSIKYPSLNQNNRAQKQQNQSEYLSPKSISLNDSSSVRNGLPTFFGKNQIENNMQHNQKQRIQSRQAKQSVKKEETQFRPKVLYAFNLQKSISEILSSNRSLVTQLLRNSPPVPNELIETAQNLWQIQSRKEMLLQDHQSRLMNQIMLAEKIESKIHKVQGYKSKEWGDFEYDIPSYMAFVEKEIQVIRMSSEIEIKRRQVSNVNLVLSHLRKQLDNQKTQFFNFIEQINSIGDEKDVKVMEEFIKSKLSKSGEQLYDVILTAFDYKLMKQKAMLHEMDEFYSIRVCSLDALCIVSEIQELVFDSIEKSFQRISKHSFIQTCIQDIARAYDSQNKTLSETFSPSESLKVYEKELTEIDLQYQSDIQTIKSNIKQKIENLDPYTCKDLIEFLNSFLNIDTLLSNFFSSVQKSNEEGGQERIQSLVMTHLKSKSNLFSKVIEVVKNNQNLIKQTENLIFQIRTTVLKMQCFDKETSELMQTMNKTLDEKIALENVLKSQRESQVFPKSQARDKPEINQKEEIAIDESTAFFLSQFQKTQGQEEKKQLIKSKVSVIKEEIKLLEKSRRDNQKWVEEEMKGDLFSLEIQIRTGSQSVVTQIQQFFSSNQTDLQVLKTVFTTDFPFIENLLSELAEQKEEQQLQRQNVLGDITSYYENSDRSQNIEIQQNYSYASSSSSIISNTTAMSTYLNANRPVSSIGQISNFSCLLGSGTTQINNFPDSTYEPHILNEHSTSLFGSSHSLRPQQNFHHVRSALSQTLNSSVNPASEPLKNHRRQQTASDYLNALEDRPELVQSQILQPNPNYRQRDSKPENEPINYLDKYSAEKRINHPQILCESALSNLGRSAASISNHSPTSDNNQSSFRSAHTDTFQNLHLFPVSKNGESSRLFQDALQDSKQKNKNSENNEITEENITSASENPILQLSVPYVPVPTQQYDIKWEDYQNKEDSNLNERKISQDKYAPLLARISSEVKQEEAQQSIQKRTEYSFGKKSMNNGIPSKQSERYSTCSLNAKNSLELNASAASFDVTFSHLDEQEKNLQQKDLQIIDKHVSQSMSCMMKEYMILFRQESKRFEGTKIIPGLHSWNDALSIGFFSFGLTFDLTDKIISLNSPNFRISIPLSTIQKLTIPSQIIKQLKGQTQSQDIEQIYTLEITVIDRGVCEIVSKNKQTFVAIVEQFQSAFL